TTRARSDTSMEHAAKATSESGRTRPARSARHVVGGITHAVGSAFDAVDSAVRGRACSGSRAVTDVFRAGNGMPVHRMVHSMRRAVHDVAGRVRSAVNHMRGPYGCP